MARELDLLQCNRLCKGNNEVRQIKGDSIENQVIVLHLILHRSVVTLQQ